MKTALRRLVFGFLVLTFSFLFLAIPHARAQSTNTQSPIANRSSNEALGTDPNVPNNLHNVTQVVMIETMSGILCQLTGVDYAHPNQKCLGVDPKSGKIGFVGNGGGVIGVMGTMISYTLTPPVSSRQYIAYLQNNFGLTKHAYASGSTGVCDATRGLGFCGLWPIVNLWISMRNIVYLIFIIVFVVVGLGIMLRLHIDPQTVMTLQNQIPKIIIAIIGITFSFAIAGFLIDVMWVATYLFASVLASSAGGLSNFNSVVQAINPFDAANALPGGVGGIAGGASNAFANVIKEIFTGPVGSFSNGDLVMGIIGGALFILVNILAWLIIAIAVVVALIRLWVILIITYLNIILDVIFAPWWILAGVVPGSPISLGSWLRDMVANLAVYPMVVSFFLLASIFMTAYKQNQPGRFQPPLVGGVDQSTIIALIGLGFIMMLPTLLTTMKAALKAPKIDLGPFLGPIGSAGKTLRAGASAYSTASSSTKDEMEQKGFRRLFKKGLS